MKPDSTSHSLQAFVLAIDGPAGAGKSTIARRVARTLGFQLVETGAIYRAVAYHAIKCGIQSDDDEALAEMASQLDFSFQWDNSANVMLCNGQELREALRAEAVGNFASKISQHARVREALLGTQRELGRARSSVLEGRDIGTVVFPDADLKVFLTASPQERAKRRYEELEGKCVEADYDTILREMRERDRRDTERDVAPLRPARDAVEVDTTHLSIDEVVKSIVERANAIERSDAVASDPSS